MEDGNGKGIVQNFPGFENDNEDTDEEEVLEDAMDDALDDEDVEEYLDEDEDDEEEDEEEGEEEEEEHYASSRGNLASFALRFVESSTARKVIVALSIAAVLLLVQMYFLPAIGLGQERYLRMIQTEHGVDYDFDASPKFYSNNSRFYYHVTRDGISMRSSNDLLVWHNSFSFNRPLAVARGDIIAVSEMERGRLIHVFNADGPLFSTSFDDPVLSFNVNAAGFLSVIVQYEGGYGVYVLNSYQTLSSDPVFTWSVFRHDQDLIHPIFAEVSDDGRYIAIAYVDLNTRVTTTIEFRYINQWDAWGTEMGLFAAEIFDGIVLAMRFMSGNRLLVMTGDRIICFQVGPARMQLDSLWTNQLENRIDFIEFYGDSHFVLAIGDRLVGTFGEGYPIGTIHIYNMNGARTGSFQTGRRASHLNVGHNAVIAGADRSFTAIDFRGVLLWEFISMVDTRDVIFLDDTSSILVAGPTRANVYRRLRVRDNGGGSFFEAEMLQ